MHGTPCPVALDLVHKLEIEMEQIPEHNPQATSDHPLNIFSGDLKMCIEPGLED